MHDELGPIQVGPVLPPWSTDLQVRAAVNEIENDLRMVTAQLDNIARLGGPLLASEAEAFLKHEAEGWLPAEGSES